MGEKKKMPAKGYKTVLISSLKLDPKNANTHPEKNIRAIMGSLRQYGQQKNLVVSSDGYVMAGNGTLEAAKRLGWEKIEIKQSTLTAEELRGFALADNRTSELSKWDKEVLKETFDELGWEDLSDVGFKQDEWEKKLQKDKRKERRKRFSERLGEFCIMVECADQENTDDLLTEFRERGYKVKAI